MTEHMNTPQTEQLLAATDEALKQLGDALVGTWEISGGAQGQVRYDWMDGGFFLIQTVDLGDNKGIEIIGREQAFGATQPGEDIRSRFYGNKGETFDYVYELDEDTLTIWGGEKNAPAYFKGTLSHDGNTLTGGWIWPGGGYESVARRVNRRSEITRRPGSRSDKGTSE